jgi:hypothetical protein
MPLRGTIFEADENMEYNGEPRRYTVLSSLIFQKNKDRPVDLWVQPYNYIVHVQNGSGAHLASYPMGKRGSFPGGKAAGVLR